MQRGAKKGRREEAKIAHEMAAMLLGETSAKVQGKGGRNVAASQKGRSVREEEGASQGE